jgi:hypothetical protein
VSSADLRRIAAEQNRRDHLEPVADPAVLRRVAVLLAKWRERRKGQAA